MKKYILPLIVYLLLSTAPHAQQAWIEWAKIQAPRLVVIQMSSQPVSWPLENIRIVPDPDIRSVQVTDRQLKIETAAPFQLNQHYYLVFPDGGRRFLQPDGILDSLYSEKPLGCRKEAGEYAFRLFAPRAKWVRLLLFDHPDDPSGRQVPMQRDQDGVWEAFLSGNLSGKFYGYRVWGPAGEGEMFDSTLVLADPYSRAAATRNHFTHPAKSLILPEAPFDWQGDTGVNIPARDLLIYEMHVRDMTADRSCGLPDSLRGTYRGLVETNQRGGLAHILNLGVNAVELLPVQEFGNIEIP